MLLIRKEKHFVKSAGFTQASVETSLNLAFWPYLQIGTLRDTWEGSHLIGIMPFSSWEERNKHRFECNSCGNPEPILLLNSVSLKEETLNATKSVAKSFKTALVSFKYIQLAHKAAPFL